MPRPRRDEFNLTALEDTLVIDVEAGVREKTTKVQYRKNEEWTILHRIQGDDWIPVGFDDIVGRNDPRHKSGEFETLKLRPGQMYQACIVPRDFTPDPAIPMHEFIFGFEGEEAPPASVYVVALRKRPEQRSFYIDGNSRTYGTYHERDVFTNTDVMGVLSVSRQQWVDAGDGVLTMPGPKAVVSRGPQTTFMFRIGTNPGDNLLPGTPYFELLLLVDEFGNWEFRTDNLTMLRRRVEAELTELWVHDDSDRTSTGEGVFKFSVGTMDDSSKSNILVFNNPDFDDGTVVPALGKCVLGPVAVTDGTKRLYFFGSCYEDDSGSFPFEGDDFDAGHQELHIPVGPGETFSAVDQRLKVGPKWWADNLSFTATYKYSIDYE
jgi:hypothetical protein